jgi:hypothetical protein
MGSMDRLAGGCQAPSTGDGKGGQDRVQGSGFRVQGSRFKVQGSGFRTFRRFKRFKRFKRFVAELRVES